MRLVRCILIVFVAFITIAEAQPQRFCIDPPLNADTLSAQAPSIFMNERSGTKSITLAVVMSLVIPGMGELYAGNASTAKYFFIAEGGIWLTYTGFQLHGTWLRRDARSFASQHSGANYSGKDDKFAVNVGYYESTETYNEAKLRARQNDILYTGLEYNWRWDSEINRNGYRDMRIRSDEAYRNANFAVAALVVNRLASAFFAGRSAAAYNNMYREENNWKMEAIPKGGILNSYGIELRISKTF
ncbi:MAG: hypothetical protein V1799_06765 [bacterium]